MGKKIALGIFILFLISALVIALRWQYRKKHDPYATFILPRLNLTEVHIDHITKNIATVQIQMQIHNPSPFGLHVDSLEYQVFIAGREIVKTTHTESMDIQAIDSVQLELPLKIEIGKLKKIIDSLQLLHIDSAEYEIRSQFYINLPFLNHKPQQITIHRYLPLYIFPDVKITGRNFENTSFENSTLVMHARFVNNNRFGFALKNINYRMRIDDRDIAAGAIAGDVLVPPLDTVYISIPLLLQLKEIAASLPDILFNKDDTPYTFYAELEIVSEDRNIKDSKVIIESDGPLKEITDLGK